jgi:hypothetical protein
MHILINGLWCLLIGGFLSIVAGQTTAPVFFGLLSVAVNLAAIYWFVKFLMSKPDA